jgi:hypothetical protein
VTSFVKNVTTGSGTRAAAAAGTMTTQPEAGLESVRDSPRSRRVHYSDMWRVRGRIGRGNRAEVRGTAPMSVLRLP